ILVTATYSRSSAASQNINYDNLHPIDPNCVAVALTCACVQACVSSPLRSKNCRGGAAALSWCRLSAEYKHTPFLHQGMVLGDCQGMGALKWHLLQKNNLPLFLL